jgi:uncharacterized membrane protein
MTASALERLLRAAAIVWVGMMAGFFFAFSVVVMPGLTRLEPLAAMAAMQAINVAVANTAFFAGFFGAPVLCLALIGVGLARRDGAAWLGALAGIVYLLGVFGVTVGFNVPLNEALAVLDPTDPGNAGAMAEYLRTWPTWNHVRTVSGVVSVALLAVGRPRAAAREGGDGAPA